MSYCHPLFCAREVKSQVKVLGRGFKFSDLTSEVLETTCQQAETKQVLYPVFFCTLPFCVVSPYRTMPDVLLFCCSIVLLFHCFIVLLLLFYCSIVIMTISAYILASSQLSKIRLRYLILFFHYEAVSGKTENFAQGGERERFNVGGRTEERKELSFPATLTVRVMFS